MATTIESMGTFASNEIRVDLDGDQVVFWTFAGTLANLALSQCLESCGFPTPRFDENSIRTLWTQSAADLHQAIEVARQRLSQTPYPRVDDSLLRDLKFSQCLPLPMARSILERRETDPKGVEWILGAAIRLVEI